MPFRNIKCYNKGYILINKANRLKYKNKVYKNIQLYMAKMFYYPDNVKNLKNAQALEELILTKYCTFLARKQENITKTTYKH